LAQTSGRDGFPRQQNIGQLLMVGVKAQILKANIAMQQIARTDDAIRGIVTLAQ